MFPFAFVPITNRRTSPNKLCEHTEGSSHGFILASCTNEEEEEEEEKYDTTDPHDQYGSSARVITVPGTIQTYPLPGMPSLGFHLIYCCHTVG